ncbi:MAG: TolC family protein [Bacteroidota bacterium]
MRLFSLSVLLFILFEFPSNKVTAQKSTIPNDAAIDMSFAFPPLEDLIDSAMKRNPLIRFRELGIGVKKANLFTYRSNWTRNLGIQADIRYGTFDNFSTNTSEGQNPSIIATRTNQTNYGVGAYIKFPFQDIINRHSLIKGAKAELDQAESMYESQKDELRLLVIKQYNDLLLKQRLLRIRAKYLGTSRVNMEMVEKEFQNGVVPVVEYSRISEIVSRAESDFENARSDFITAYMILEETIGFKFNPTENKQGQK